MALERLSCHKDFKITQAPTKVGFFYLSPLLQVEFRAIFEPFSYILLNFKMAQNVTQCCHVRKSQKNVWAACGDSKVICSSLSCVFERVFDMLLA